MKPHTRSAVIWSAVVIIAGFGAVVVIVAFVQARPGEPYLENPGALVGTAITAIGGVLAAIVGTLSRTEKAAEAVKAQVLNGHGDAPPMRVEQDNRHDEYSRRFESLETGIFRIINGLEAAQADIRGLRRDVGRAAGRLDEHDRRLNAGERRGDRQDEQLKDLRTDITDAQRPPDRV